MRDQEQRETACAPQAEQQVQHLGAHRDVECRHGLVADDARPARERARWRSRRAGADRPRARADSGARSARQARARRPRAPSPRATRARPSHPLHAQRLLHELAHAHARVERLVWILEHHLHLAPQRAHTAAIEGRALEAQLAAARLLEPEQRARQRRLAAAGIADDAEHLVLAPLEVDAVERVHACARGGGTYLERARLCERCEHRRAEQSSSQAPTASAGGREEAGRLVFVADRAEPHLAASRPRARGDNAGGSGSRMADRRDRAANPGWRAAASARCRPAGMRRAAAGCRGAAARPKTCGGPLSTILPAYITATRSQVSAITPGRG